jgi:hypothetical protein
MIEVIQSFNVVITTTGVETIVMPNTNVTKRGIVIGLAINLNYGSNGLSMRRNLNRNSRLPMVNTRVVGTPQMVFTNPIMTTHVHKTTNRPHMSSIVVGGYRSTNIEDSKGGR